MNHTPETAPETLRQQAFNHLKNLYNLDNQTVETLLIKASNALGEDLQTLREAAAAADLEKSKKTGHSLKGALLNLGLEELATRAKELEQAPTLDQAALKAFVERLESSDLL